jgi:hypothetical protein
MRHFGMPIYLMINIMQSVKVLGMGLGLLSGLQREQPIRFIIVADGLRIRIMSENKLLVRKPTGILDKQQQQQE